MKKYKDTYIFRYNRDINGKIYNRDDNHLLCRGGAKIWRYNDEILVYESPRKTKLIKKDDNGEIIEDYRSVVIKVEDSEVERLIYFYEKDLDKLADLFKLRRKKQISEEQKEMLAKRLAEVRNAV